MFTIAQAGDSYKILDETGAVYTTLVLPTGVTIDTSRRSQFHMLANKLIITDAPSVNLWVDPMDFSVRPLGIFAPATPPTIAVGGGTGLSGVVYAAYSYIVEINGVVVQESPLSPLSLPLTLADDDIDWSNLVPSTEAHVTGYRLYRTLEDGTPGIMFEVAIIGNQIDTTYANDAFPTAGLALQPSPLVGNAPGGTVPGTRLQCCIQWNDRLWGVPDDDTNRHTVFYTESGNPFAWVATNFINAPVKGEDETGVVGFIARRDELIVAKRRRVGKIIGSSIATADAPAIFEYIGVAENIGIVARDSCVTIDDIGFGLGDEGVWRFGPEGPQSITEGKIGTYYQTDNQFEPSLRHRAMAGYNPLTFCYELFAATTGISNTALLDAWVAGHKKSSEWCGPHVTGVGDGTYCRGSRFDENGRLIPVLGNADGYLYDMSQPEAYDTDGDGTIHGIPIQWRSKRYGGDGGFYRFGKLSLIQRAQGDAAGTFRISVWVGPMDERNLFAGPGGVSAEWSQNAPLSIAHWESPSLGSGESCSLTIAHNLDTAEPVYGSSRSDVELFGLDFPFFLIGRRERSGYGR